ncbi:MAG TPA: hypothetical protein VH682_12370 [Gemmataceae bacterium]|jgi:hypothetical protein
MSDSHVAPGVSAVVGRAVLWWRLLLAVALTAVVTLGLAAAGIYLSGGRLTFGSGSELLVQQGDFEAVINTEGVVYFPRPYASPPNVELAGRCQNTVVTECAQDHFRWKNTRTGKNEQQPAPFGGTTDVFGSEGRVQWNARGISVGAP